MEEMIMLFKVSNKHNVADHLFEYFDTLQSKTYKQVMWFNGVVYLYGLIEPNEECKSLEYHYLNDYHCFLGVSQNKYKYMATPISSKNDFITYSDLLKLINFIKNNFTPHKTDIMFLHSSTLASEIKANKDFVYNNFAPDYVFERTDICALHGRRFQNKRSLIHKFKREHPNAKIRLFEYNDLNGVEKVYKSWKTREQAYGKKIHSDKTLLKQIEFVLSPFGKQISRMYVCEENNIILGYILYGKLCKDTIQTVRRTAILFPEYVGLSDYLFHETLNMLDFDYVYINDNNGGLKSDSLNFWKQHYYPIDLIDTFYISLR